MLLARFLFASMMHALVACASDPEPPMSAATPYSADVAPTLEGVPDRGRDPAVIALSRAGEPACSGVLVAPDIALTSRGCVAERGADASCALVPPHSIDVLSGDDLDHAAVVGHGLRVIVPSDRCEDDVAMVILDRAVPMIHTAAFRRFGPRSGDHLRTVGFGPWQETYGRLLRDHASVHDVTERMFEVQERPCIGPGGHVAFDEDTGDVVGVVASAPRCDAGAALYTRTDAFLSFVSDGLVLSGEAAREAKAALKDAGPPDAWTPKKLPKSQKPSKDLGDACALGADCAAGVCVAASGGARYCSRSCGPTDHCPRGWRCIDTARSRKVCIKSAS